MAKVEFNATKINVSDGEGKTVCPGRNWAYCCMYWCRRFAGWMIRSMVI